MKIGGTAAFWVKVGIGAAALYLLWRIYKGTAGMVADVGEKVGRVIGDDIRATDVTALPGYDEATRRVYDPSLDTRSWWDRITGVAAPSSAYRLAAPEDQLAAARYEGT